MNVEIEFPFEFVIAGVPVSLQVKRPKTKEAWIERVNLAANARLPEGHFLTAEPVEVTIYYFPDTKMDGDLDNIIKPILDSLIGCVYFDDAQIEKISVQKFEPGRVALFAEPSVVLEETREMVGPRVYIRVDLIAAQEFKHG